MTNQKLKVHSVPVSVLREAEYNPRRLTVKQEADLTKSLKKFKLLDPIIVNQFKGRENVVISGHQRLKVAKKLGYSKVPVVYVNLNPQKEKELNLTMNKVQGEWDFELLKQFNIETLLDVGFDDSELSQIWDNNLEIEDDSFDEAEELKKIKKTNIKSGDMFQLGDHYLICGDSHEPDTLNKLMGKTKANIIYNDPIYNIGVNYNKGIGGKASYGGEVKDKKSDEEYKEFLKQGLINSIAHADDNCHVFTWCDQSYVWLVQTLYRELGIKNERVCFWFKGSFNPTPNVAFNKAVEHCIYGTKGRPYLSKLSTKTCEALNKEIDTGNRAIDDILGILEIWLAKRDAGSEYNHSTQKPLTLHEKPLLRCTKPGDIVLDIYGGSGSTLLSCEQLKRVCYTAEINPIFCQLIINRFEKYGNQKTKKIN